MKVFYRSLCSCANTHSIHFTLVFILLDNLSEKMILTDFDGHISFLQVKTSK